MTDKVKLCNRCNTMKHVNAAGYCGRCQDDPDLNKNSPEVSRGVSAARNSIAGELREQIVKIVDLEDNHLLYRGDDHDGYCDGLIPPAIDELMSIFITELEREKLQK